MTTTTTYRRAPMFDSVAELLDWSERQHAIAPPRLHDGPDGSVRGSVEVAAGDEQTQDEGEVK